MWRVWAGRLFLAGEGLVELGLELVASLEQGAQDGTVEQPDPVGGMPVSSARRAWAGWSIQSVARQRANTSTAVSSPCEGDEGLVGVAAAGHGDVEAADVGGPVEEEEGAVDGAALGGVAGRGVGQLDVLGDVAGGETAPSRAGR